MTYYDFLAAALVCVASLAVGGLVGWVVGLSDSPVVATLLPLLFGVFTVLVSWKPKGDRMNGLIVASATAILFFSAGCYDGINSGIAKRTRHSVINVESIADGNELSPKEIIGMQKTIWHLRALRVPDREVKALMNHVFGKILDRGKSSGRERQLLDAAKEITDVALPSKSLPPSNPHLQSGEITSKLKQIEARRSAMKEDEFYKWAYEEVHAFLQREK